MILVAGATGNIGRVLVNLLPGPVRALSRTPAAATIAGHAATGGCAETAVGDLAEVASVRPALDGVRSLFLPSGIGADHAVLTAAAEAGVEHVVLVSSITVDTHPGLGPARANRAVEDTLMAGGLDWTILRPTQFASNALWWAPAIQAGRAVRLPFPDIGLPTVHPADIAAVAAKALTDPAHRGRAHVLTGPARITAREQVAAIAAALGRHVPVEHITRDEAHADLAAVMGDEVAAAVLDVTGGDVNDALLEVRGTVERVTGSPARTFAAWARENTAAFG